MQYAYCVCVVTAYIKDTYTWIVHELTDLLIIENCILCFEVKELKPAK